MRHLRTDSTLRRIRIVEDGMVSLAARRAEAMVRLKVGLAQAREPAALGIVLANMAVTMR